VVCIALKSSHTKNMLLRIKSSWRYIQHKLVKLVYYHIRKGTLRIVDWLVTVLRPAQEFFTYIETSLTIVKSKSSRLSNSVVVSLPLKAISSKISRCEADLLDSVVSSISSSLGYFKWRYHDGCHACRAYQRNH
jgi:hypothetical protein